MDDYTFNQLLDDIAVAALDMPMWKADNIRSFESQARGDTMTAKEKYEQKIAEALLEVAAYKRAAERAQEDLANVRRVLDEERRSLQGVRLMNTDLRDQVSSLRLALQAIANLTEKSS